jgi:L-rhamnose mutarotase
MERYGAVIQLRPDKVNEYMQLHRAVWPQVKDRMAAANIRNYTIFYHDGWLFNYFEYTGNDYARDMGDIAADLKTQEWWALTMPCQLPLKSRQPGEWWTTMKEIYHQD